MDAQRDARGAGGDDRVVLRLRDARRRVGVAACGDRGRGEHDDAPRSAGCRAAARPCTTSLKAAGEAASFEPSPSCPDAVTATTAAVIANEDRSSSERDSATHRRECNGRSTGLRAYASNARYEGASSGVDVERRRGDHGRVVDAQGRGREQQPHAARGAQLGERRAQRRVGRDAAGDRERVAARRVERVAGALDERRDDRLLVAGGEVAARRVRAVAELGDRARERRLEPRERDVAARAPGERARERLAARIPAARELLERGTSRVGQAEQARALVERLARRIVERPAERHQLAGRRHVEEQRVPARGEQAEERRLDARRREGERRDVPAQVVDRRERQPARPGDRLAGREADEQRADQARALRRRDERDRRRA